MKALQSFNADWEHLIRLQFGEPLALDELHHGTTIEIDRGNHLHGAVSVQAVKGVIRYPVSVVRSSP